MRSPTRPLNIAALALAGALWLTAGPVRGAAPTTQAEQRQKLERLRDVNAQARDDATELRREMNGLQAEAIGRGLLLTLDDAWFTTNAVGLSIPGHRRLGALADFLEHHPDRNVAIDGYAGEGNYRYDQSLSTRRADAIKGYLIQRGVASDRLTARGNADSPQDDGSFAITEPLPRRVEVIIEDSPSSAPQRDLTAPGT